MDGPVLLRRPGFGVGDDLLDRGDPVIALRSPFSTGCRGGVSDCVSVGIGSSSLPPDSAMLIIHSRRRGGAGKPTSDAIGDRRFGSGSAVRDPRGTRWSHRRSGIFRGTSSPGGRVRVGRVPSPLRRRSVGRDTSRSPHRGSPGESLRAGPGRSGSGRTDRDGDRGGPDRERMGNRDRQGPEAVGFQDAFQVIGGIQLAERFLDGDFPGDGGAE